MGWSYAELSKLAKINGGPEKLVDLLIKSGEKKMHPWLGVAFAGGVVATVGVQELIEYFSKKKVISSAEVELAKKEIIQGIKDHDSAQNPIENKTIEDSDENTEVN